MKSHRKKAMLHLSILCGLFLAFGNSGFAQVEMSKTNLYFQFEAGYNIGWSLSSEFRVSDREKVTWYASAGAGYGGGGL